MHDYDAAHIEPGWHAWMSYSVDKPPTQDPLLNAGTRAFEPSRAVPNFTQTKGAFKTYNTYVHRSREETMLTVIALSPRWRHGSPLLRLGNKDEMRLSVHKFT